MKSKKLLYTPKDYVQPFVNKQKKQKEKNMQLIK